ncbi:luciferase family oxidoreductase, group 1 [Streptococcus urinalis FB127-CNA-2]|uniref:Luciferase family oxidoreductase, group 1 n=1 Tax=Streptococcus urinalis 2285-97 TaxID=764291 RepID=G5KG82_9STRE|nr:LLM class flavin-dependent oxidoreductase [Streptococcus urinalis]EHJ56311.1 luciferase family oxidoreductase, group 1 [Streptococcus urinalis 2285-97]EKS22292.1 luciferase family oxidoreductase, group 1 [Streptococcus urinalis FB127-CNA-2]VEF32104.1 luciferase oxidoreductase, group 1 family protein [Streptococcus urinalis]
MKLSVLDYGQIDEGKSAKQALQESVKLAKIADSLGYSRFWVAEHHNVNAFAISSPELLMMQIASQTQKIRVGSGGIMVLHYSDYKIAENINTLEALYPNRIDLGMGNSLGTKKVHQALNSIHQKADYFQMLQDIKNWFQKNHSAINVQPTISTKPQLWTLSNSTVTAEKTAELGLGYTFGVFPYIPKDPLLEGKKVSSVYYDHFQPSEFLKQPHLILAVFICIADTDEKAQEYAKSLDIWMLGKNDFNEFNHYPSYETATEYQKTDEDRKQISKNRKRMIVGSPEKVKEQLTPLIEATQADELLMIPLLPGIESRIRALELLANLY